MIRGYLTDKDLKYRVGTDQRILLFFNSLILGSVTIRLTIEGDSICLIGSLPPVPDADEVMVLGNLLQGMTDVMYYRPAGLGLTDLHLLCWMPIRYLNPDWLEFLVRGLSHYADMQPALPQQAGRYAPEVTLLHGKREDIRGAAPPEIIPVEIGDFFVGHEKDREFRFR